MTDDGSSSEWSLVSEHGDLLDSDFSISESASESADNLRELASNDEDNQSNINGSDYRCILDESDDTDADTNMTDVEEIDYSDEENLIELNSNQQIASVPNLSVNDNLCSSSDLPDNFFSLDIQTGRRVQIFVFASVLSVLLMSAFFGNLFGVHQLRSYCYSKEAESFADSIRFNEQVLSFDPTFESKPLWSEQVNDDDYKDDNLFEEKPEKSELYQCHQDLNDAVKTASLNSMLMRYMRSKNSRLETLIQELQSFVDLQRQEIESLQQASPDKSVPLLSEPLDAGQLIVDDYPCVGDSDNNISPSDQPSNPTLPPAFIPDNEVPKSDVFGFDNEHFFNLTRSFLNRMASMANSTALTLFVESRPELAKLTNWLQKQTLKAFPRMIDNVRSNWRTKFRSYMQKVSNALSSPAITSLTKPRNVVGTLKKKLKSVFSHLSKSSWLQNDGEVCSTNSTCDLLLDFGNYLADDSIFRSNLTPKEADSYIEYLKHIPSRQCVFNSTIVACEQCWWVGKCEGMKKKCNLRRWQRQRRIDPNQYIDGSPKIRKVFKDLGWIDSKDFTTRPQSEPIGPPRHAKAKRLSKKEKHLKNDWLMRRGARRAEQRKRSTESAWFFERQAQRTALRHSDQSSDWLFDRGSQRAMLRQH